MTVQNMTPEDTGPTGVHPITLRGKHAIAAYCGPGVSVHRVLAALRSGDLPTLDISGAYVVLTADVDAWLLSLRGKSA